MKNFLILLSFAAASFIVAQSTTNNLSVVLDVGKDALLKASWNYDTQLRTNALPPYTNVVAAQSFKAYVEGVAAEALSEKVLNLQARREAEMLALWRAAAVNKQNRALRDLQ